MRSIRSSAVGTLILIGILVASTAGWSLAATLTPLERLGEAIFFDAGLSIELNQSCAACHAKEAGWTGPDAAINAHGAVYEGSISGRFGNRKPPSSAYATDSPIFHFRKQAGGLFLGGNFWDGRATGEKLGNPAADQAQGPFLNPAEQALPDSACVVYRVCHPGNGYPVSFEAVWGDGACDIAWPSDVEMVCTTEGAMVLLSPEDRETSHAAFDNVALSIAAYEASPEVNRYTSRFDLALQDLVKLTQKERSGFALFQGKAKCARCHPSSGRMPLFTDFSYDNLGLPKNPENPFYTVEPDFVDTGLGGFLAAAGYSQEVWSLEVGKHKVPTLRNVGQGLSDGLVKAYGHNGYFKSLGEIVHFYNTRDVLPQCSPGDPGEKVSCWPPPEVPENVNRSELGNLKLTDQEEDAIIAFLEALSDGVQP